MPNTKKRTMPVIPAALFVGILLIGINSMPLAAGDSLMPQPPNWSVGDWWTVDCEVYDTARVVTGATPGWRSKQGWMFTVENLEAFDNENHFVILVKPTGANACPYSFRYWFRESDRYVSRLDLIHPDGSRGREFKAGTITKTYGGAAAAPYSTFDFPTLPMAVPIFGADAKALSGGTAGFSGHPAAYAVTSQVVEPIPSIGLHSTKADTVLSDVVKMALLEGDTALIKITRGGMATDRQYWSSKLPWYAYGESEEEQTLTRRYWLTGIGKK